MRILRWIVLALITAVAVIFALSNREDVSFDLWPILKDPVNAPPFVVVFVGLVVGVLLGGLIAWGAGRKWRQLARTRDQELRRTRRELARIGGTRPRTGDGEPPSLAASEVE